MCSPSINSLVVAIALLLSTLAPLRTQAQTKYTRNLTIATEAVGFGDACVWLNLVLSEGDFFDGLTRWDSTNGSEFRKGSETVSTYPEHVTVQIEAYAYRCSRPSRPLPPRDVSALIDSFRFEVRWKTGLKMHAVQEISVARHNLSDAEARHPPGAFQFTGRQRARRGTHWVFELKVPAKDVPLTTSLVVMISAGEGPSARRTRFCVRP